MKTKILVWGFGELRKEPYRLGLTKEPEEINCTICIEMSFSFLRKILLKMYIWTPVLAQCIRDCLQSLKSAVQGALAWSKVKLYSKGCRALKSSGDRNEKQALNYVLCKGRYLGKIPLSLGKYCSLLVKGKRCTISNIISKLICSERLKEITWKSIYYSTYLFLSPEQSISTAFHITQESSEMTMKGQISWGFIPSSSCRFRSSSKLW